MDSDGLFRRSLQRWCRRARFSVPVTEDDSANDSLSSTEPKTDDCARRLALAQELYTQLHGNTVHLEDRIYRFFGGIAFIATGALAFGLRQEVFLIRFESPNGVSMALPAVFFLGFLLFLVLGVAVMLSGLLTSSYPPPFAAESTGAWWRWKVGAEGRRPARRLSKLDYFDIAGQPPSMWQASWYNTSTEDLERQVAADLVRESHALALNALFKHGRAEEARVLFTTAFVWLAAGFAVTTYALVQLRPPSQGGVGAVDLSSLRNIPWDGAARLIVFAVASFFGAIFAYERYRTDQHVFHLLAKDRVLLETALTLPTSRGQSPRVAFYALAVPLFAWGALGVPPDLSDTWRMTLVVIGVVVAEVAAFQTLKLGGWQGLQFLVGILLASSGCAAVATGDERWQLAVVGLAIFVIQLRPLLFSTVAWVNIRRNLRLILADQASRAESGEGNARTGAKSGASAGGKARGDTAARRQGSTNI